MNSFFSLRLFYTTATLYKRRQSTTLKNGGAMSRFTAFGASLSLCVVVPSLLYSWRFRFLYATSCAPYLKTNDKLGEGEYIDRSLVCSRQCPQKIVIVVGVTCETPTYLMVLSNNLLVQLMTTFQHREVPRKSLGSLENCPIVRTMVRKTHAQSSAQRVDHLEFRVYNIL